MLQINGTAARFEPNGDFVEVFAPQGPQRNIPICRERAVGLGAPCTKSRYTETLPNGVSYSVLDTISQDTSNLTRINSDTTRIYTVPDGHYFFMGDNRDNSSDSRIPQSARGVGFVPAKDIVGRADRIIFSSAGRRMLAFWTWRGDRFFKAIR